MEDSISGKIVTRRSAAGGDVRLRDVLRSMTQGRATYTMEFAQYVEVPANIAGAIMKKTLIRQCRHRVNAT